MKKLAVAAGNALGAQAAADVARNGGNAVDACIAAAIMAWVAEPFMTSPGGSGFLTVRLPEGETYVFDGNNAVPLEAPASEGQGLRRVFVENYSNGLYTGIGGGSVAVPGIVAALHEAWKQHGAIEWAALFEPAVRAAVEGIPFPPTSAYYLSVTWEKIWSVFPVARAMFSNNGQPLQQGERFFQPELAESLERMAEDPASMYGGDLGRAIVDEIAADGGPFTMEDLERYRCEVRRPVSTEAFGWTIHSNPPPAMGGAVVIHMLALLEGAAPGDPLARLRAFIEAEHAAMGYRAERYEDPSEIAAYFDEALTLARNRRSASTTHMSVADADGYAASLTESNGYSSGLVVGGILLNNTLGEEELNPRGAHGLPGGSRCHSNMAPSIARGPGITVALGSPGADRISGAIVQTFLALAQHGMSLQDAVAAPRAHLATRAQGKLLCFEPGLPGEELAAELGYIARPYDEPHMFFGGVQAASVTDDGTVDAANDPRRWGGCAIV